MLLSAEKTIVNTTVSEILVQATAVQRIVVHSIVLYLEAGTDPGDQISVGVQFPTGKIATLALCYQRNLGGAAINNEVNVYPKIELPLGCNLYVVGVVTGIGEYAGATVIYELINESPSLDTGKKQCGFFEEMLGVCS